MRDGFGREITYLRLSVTDRCNFRCRYCMPAEGVPLLPRSEILGFEEIYKLVKILADMGITHVRITGGEPLMRRELHKLVRLIRTIETIEEISLTTNGLLLGDQLDGLIIAGLNRVNISLDTLKKERFSIITRHDGWDDVMSAIERTLTSGLSPVKINTVIMKGVNDDEIDDFIGWTINEDIHIRFIEMMPFDVKGEEHELEYVSSRVILERLSRDYQFEDDLFRKGNGPARVYRVTGARGTFSFITPISRSFCENCNRLRLLSDGQLRLCLFSDNEINLKTPLRNGLTSDEIRGIIINAVTGEKPESHNLLVRSPEKAMANIGG